MISSSARLANGLLWVAVGRVALVTVGLVLAVLRSRIQDDGDTESWRYILLWVAYGYALGSILILQTGSSYLNLLAHIQLVIDTCLVTGVVVLTGGAESIFSFLYVVVVLEGSMVLLTLGALLAVASGTLLFGSVLLLQLNRGLSVLPTVIANEALFMFFIHTVGVALIGFLSSRLTTKLQLADRRLAEQEEDLARLSEMQAAILRALPAGLITVSPDDLIEFGNESAHVILRKQPGDLIGCSLADILPPVSLMVAATRLTERTLSPRARHEAPVVLDDGTEIQLGYSLAPLLEPEERGPRLAETRGPSGVLRTSPPRSAVQRDGQLVEGTVVVFQDVTEIVRLEAAVAQAERLALVGKFAAGLAHEVRNPLAAMCASIDVLRQKLQPPPELQRLMNNIGHEAGRLEHLIRDFLALARPPQVELSSEDIGSLLQDVLTVFGHDRLMKGIRVEFRCGMYCPVRIDPDLMRQVFWNLLRNAAESMQSRDNALLTVEVTEEHSGFSIIIADNGVGMTEAQLKQAFEPFYTTKREGSGLGLAITQSIIQAHGGAFALRSREGEGTMATIRFATMGAADGREVRTLSSSSGEAS